MAHFNKYLDMAISFAREHKHDDSLAAFVTSIIVSGGSVLSVGFNSRSSTSLQRKYSPSPFCNSIHAEVDAILNVRKKIDLTNSKIYTVRRLRSDSIENPNIGCAKNCPMCAAIIYDYGIKRSYYTIDNQNFGVMKVVDPRN
jgi:tRNA(Arg) A34 adenosine deaminase TadA